MVILDLFHGKWWLYTVAAGVIFASGAGSAWQVQSWRQASKENDRAQLQLTTEREWAKNNAKRQDVVIAAQNAGKVREDQLRTAANGARLGLDGLRDAAVSSLLAASADLKACAAHAATQNIVFLECADRYRAVAAEADLWTNDAQTLDEAWLTDALSLRMTLPK